MERIEYQFRTQNDLGKRVGAFILKTRKERGYENHTQFSKKANIARSSLFNIEKGLPSTMVSVDNVLKALDLTWADIAKVLDGREK
jgi:predicted transcriptional regulator